MKIQRTELALALAAALAFPVFAADTRKEEKIVIIDGPMHFAAAEAGKAEADAWGRWAQDYSRDMRNSMGAMFSPRLGGHTVKGAPYSAEVVTESNQALPDGNMIQRKTSGAVYRDGEGRTRQESGGDGKRRAIYIQDPVAGKNIVLTPESKRAIETSMPRIGPVTIHADTISSSASATSKDGKVTSNRQVFRTGDTELRIEDGKVFMNGKDVTDMPVNVRTSRGKEIRVENGRVTIDGKPIEAPIPPTPPTAPTAPQGATPRTETRVIESKDADGNVKRQEIRVQVMHMDGLNAPLAPMPPMPPGSLAAPVPPIPPIPPLPGIHTMRFESTAKLGKGATTNLGMKDFDGVKAEGKSTVWTIPAGEIGNRNPINITSETWYSPDLQVTVSSRYNDPRTGESVYRLANLRRGEPAADLFTVPSEYALKDKARK